MKNKMTMYCKNWPFSLYICLLYGREKRRFYPRAYICAQSCHHVIMSSCHHSDIEKQNMKGQPQISLK